MTKDILRIYRSLSSDIVSMKLKPGKMIKEADIAAQFNVSRTPVRDVFKKLEYDKLLVIISQKGSFVSKIDLSGITDIMYIRNQVELSVLTELMKVITPGDIADLKMNVFDQEDLLSKGVIGSSQDEVANQFFELDNQFHTHIYKMAGKESVLNSLNTSWPSFSRYRFLTFYRNSDEISNLCQIHSQIVDCLAKKDLPRMVETVKNHNFSGLNGLETVRFQHPDYFE